MSERFKKEGESILHVIEKPKIFLHKSGGEIILGAAATLVSAGAGAHERTGATGFGAAGVGGLLGGSRSVGAASHQTQTQHVNQQSDRIPADRLILTDKRLLGVIGESSVTLEAYYDRDFFRQAMLGQKRRNADIEEANRPKPDEKDNKYTQKTGIAIHNYLQGELRELGYVDNTYVLADIEIKKGLLGSLMGWTFYIEVAQVSTPLAMKDNEGALNIMRGKPRGIIFTDEIKEKVSVAKCDIHVKEDKKQHIDNQQLMAEFTQSAQAKIRELREYAFQTKGKNLLISNALRKDFEA